MAKRSLKATPTGIARAKQAFQRTGWTQEYLAGEVGLETRQSIWKFFSGRPVERHIFIDICFRLDLEWEEIAEPPEVEPLSVHLDRISHKISKAAPDEVNSVSPGAGLQKWVEQSRAKLFAQVNHQCDGLHSPFMLSQPLQVSKSYVATEFVTELSHQRWLNIEELEELFWKETADDQPSLTQASRLPFQAVMEGTSRLVVVGNAGTGKTTLLKHLALQCNNGQFQSHCIPIFISLSSLQKNQHTPITLKEYILGQLSHLDLTSAQSESILKEGRVQLFLDGLDEVDSPQQIAHNIAALCQQFPTLPIIISHRPVGVDAQFSGFRYVEIANFSDVQIQCFAQKWFANYSSSEGTCTEDISQEFMAQLEDPKQLSLKQLARCPLVLLGLCIIFQRTGSLHTDEARLYRTLSVLLVSRWSQIKGIAHTSTVLEVEISPLLGWLAVKMLEKDQIFIERSQLLDNITEYLMQEMGLSSSFLDCHHTSLAILQMLISKTGIWVEKSQEIYAFFHLRLQKSLAAQHISCRVKHSRKSAVYNKGIKFSLSKTGRALGNPPPTEHSLAHKIRHRLTYKSVTA